MIIIVLFLVALAYLALFVILAAGALAGACTGAALGGVLPWVHRPAVVKGVAQPNILGQVLRGTLGMLTGGIIGGVIGLAIAALGLWAAISLN